MDFTFQPLGKVASIIEEMGLEVSYTYGDLVFVEHNPFLVQYGNNERELLVYFNSDCPDTDVRLLMDNLVTIASEQEMYMVYNGRYSMEQDSEEMVNISFENALLAV
jgi:hypothetical protein